MEPPGLKSADPLRKRLKKNKNKRSNTLKTKKKSYKLTDRKYYLRRKENQANRQLQGWWGLWEGGGGVSGVGGWHGGWGRERRYLPSPDNSEKDKASRNSDCKPR